MSTVAEGRQAHVRTHSVPGGGGLRPTSPSISFVSCDPTAPGSGSDGEVPLDTAPGPPRRRRLRRLVEPLLLVALAGSAFAATELDSASPFGQRPGLPPATGQPAGPEARRQSPQLATARLIAPTTARAGERITVVGYRDSSRCGPSELRFDGAAVDHQITATAAPHTPRVTEIFIAVTIPPAATLGTHQVELYGPVDGGRRGPLCDVPERHGRLASAEINIGP